MSSTTKALELLHYFTESRPEIGLSQLCRMASRDKATTYRNLQDLEAAGFVDQNPLTKQYRLGPAYLYFARLRESHVPRKEGARSAVAELAARTGETAHVSILSGGSLYALVSCESPDHSIRAVIDIATLPLHATASGISVMAFGPDHLFDLACRDLKRFTDDTPTDPAQLRPHVDRARQQGFGRGARFLESEVEAISAPVFDQTGVVAGAVSVASVATRFTASHARKVRAALTEASREITRNWGGTMPPNVEAAWSRTLAPRPDLETAP